MPEILYQDEQIVVCVKPVGVLSQEGNGDTMPQRLRELTGSSYIGVVHRLDLTTGGIMVYGLTKRAAAALTDAVRDRKLRKEYFSIVHGAPAESGELRDYLHHDVRTNKSFVASAARRGAKEAVLTYHTLARNEDATLLHICLQTGRTHQIRIQFASRQCPLYGDGKYGARDHLNKIGLFACGLSFAHPITGKEMRFTAYPSRDEQPWALFPKETYQI